MSKGKILIVDDESSIIDTLKYAFNSENYETVSATTASEALEKVKQENPALIILDLGLPDSSGFEVCKAIRRDGDHRPIIFLTARSEEVDRVLGLEIGGDDYVVKPFSPREIVARAKAILRRSSSEEQAHSVDNKAKEFFIDNEQVKIFYKQQSLNLSRYEFKILSVLLNRPGRVYSREELMNRIWETPEMSLDRTVDTHIKTLRAKLRQIDPKGDPIKTHRGFGYSIKEGK